MTPDPAAICTELQRTATTPEHAAAKIRGVMPPNYSEPADEITIEQAERVLWIYDHRRAKECENIAMLKALREVFLSRSLTPKPPEVSEADVGEALEAWQRARLLGIKTCGPAADRDAMRAALTADRARRSV